MKKSILSFCSHTSLLTVTPFMLFIFLCACSANPEKIIVEDKNAITVQNIIADVETTPVSSAGDAADDPAFWYNSKAPERSLVLGTNKQQGLLVYNLNGELVQSLNVGRVNNVDVRQNITINGDIVDIAIASNRSENTLSVFSINDQGNVALIGNQPLSLPEPYGTCMYTDQNGNSFVFVNDKSGQYQQWQLNALSPLSLTLTREFKVETQPEGCSAHDHTGTLFFGEEEHGVWRLDLNDLNAQPTRLTTVGNEALVADIEGMDIYLGEFTHYLVVSSQGDNSYAVYDIGRDASKFEYRGSFRVVADNHSGIDGTQETDGLSLTSLPFGPNFPEGLMAIQDGFNRKPNEAQNFKFVNWLTIHNALKLEP